MNPEFVKYLSSSIKDVMKKEGFSDRFIDELVMGAIYAKSVAREKPPENMNTDVTPYKDVFKC
jgi:hypothetical protein